MNNPFEGLTDLQRSKLLDLLQAHTYSFTKNQEIFSIIKSDDIIAIVLEGNANIVTINYNGNEDLVEELPENSIFGTRISSIDNSEYHIIAITACKIAVIDYRKLIDISNTRFYYYNLFINNVFDIINTKIKEKNERIRILSKKTIRDRLLEYLRIERTKSRSNTIRLKTNLKELADYMAVNRSAMFRELKAMKEENFIKVGNKTITLLYDPML